MSLKSLLKVAASPTKTLVTAEILMGFQRAQGKATMVAATCPGYQYTATNILRLRLRNLTSRYLGIRFRYRFEQGPLGAGYWELWEGTTSVQTRRHKQNLPLTTTTYPTGRQLFHVHRAEIWLGGSIYLKPDITLDRDTELKFMFVVPNGNGTNPTKNWVRDVMVYSFPEDVTGPLLDPSGVALEIYSRSG